MMNQAHQMTKTRHQTPAHGAEFARAGDTFSPRVDILETEDEFVFYADVPGVDGADVDLRFVDGELLLHARVAVRNKIRFTHIEYAIGDFFRAFRIGPYIDANHISAELTDGVLKVICPKCQLTNGQQIEVKSNL